MAEERLRDREARRGASRSEPENARLLHELEVHQIELEMQNAELQQAHAVAQRGMEHYFEIFDLAPIGYFRMNEVGRMSEANLAGAALLGDVRERVVGRLFPIFVSEHSRPTLGAFLKRVFAAESAQGCEVELTREGRLPVFVELTATTAPGRKECLVAAADITARREAEAARESLEAQLRHSQKLETVGQLAGGIAHDFNNLLTVIIANASALRFSESSPTERRDRASEIFEAGNRAASLTRQLLLFSRRQAPQRQDVDLGGLVAETARMLRRVLGEKVQLEIRSPQVPQIVHADAGMLDQVVLNLAVNARDAMPRGGRLLIEIESVSLDADVVRDRSEARAGDYCCLSVTDEGSGMSAEVQAHMFEPYFTTKPVGQGSGLGLPTIYGIVQQHQGWIEVQSRPDEGTTIRIFLPRSSGSVAARPPEPDTGNILGRGETILVVEDQAPVRRTIVIALRQFGYHVLECESGAAALASWPQHRGEVQLVITDSIMPGGIDGPGLIQKLRADEPGLRVILMSGYGASEAGAGGSLGDAVGFIGKPFELDDLLTIVRRQLDAPTHWVV